MTKSTCSSDLFWRSFRVCIKLLNGKQSNDMINRQNLARPMITLSFCLIMIMCIPNLAHLHMYLKGTLYIECMWCEFWGNWNALDWWSILVLNRPHLPDRMRFFGPKAVHSSPSSRAPVTTGWMNSWMSIHTIRRFWPPKNQVIYHQNL